MSKPTKKELGRFTPGKLDVSNWGTDIEVVDKQNRIFIRVGPEFIWLVLSKEQAHILGDKLLKII